MKIFFLTLLTFVTFNCYSQINQAQDSLLKKIDLRISTAGHTLNRAGGQILSGVFLMGSGSIVALIGASYGEKPIIFLGGVMGFIGIGVNVSGVNKISIAGKQLSGSRK